MKPIYSHNYYSLTWKNLLNVFFSFLYISTACISLLADTPLTNWGHHETKQRTLNFSSLYSYRDFLNFAFNNLTQRQKKMHYMFFGHIMHTWAPSYNQTLPSIYQIVNGLIDFYVYDIYIHTRSWYAHMYVCPVHKLHCSLLLFVGIKFSGSFSQRALVGLKCFQTSGNYTFSS